jgi:hypothetical protein
LEFEDLDGTQLRVEATDLFEALKNGIVHRIAGRFAAGKDIPPEAVVGAWQVNAQGTIVGKFDLNERRDPIKWPASNPQSVRGEATD